MTEFSAAILERFRRGHGKDIDLTLRKSYRELLTKLGDPHLKLPPVVHVAGTNGKGSTCAFMRAAAEAAGYCVHVYTSPHLVTFHERIRIAGKLIGEDELAEILLECERLAEPGAITFFEAATAAAFVAFARRPADLCILEVGLGGRLDATNVIPNPAATVITRLSYDHREYLGSTMAAITREKAGIMRARTPCYAACQPSTEATVVLQQAAADLHAPLYVGEKDWRLEKVNANNFRLITRDHSLALPTPALAGQHQLENAGLAMAALDAVPLAINADAKRQAMLSVDWPARLQRLTRGALADLLPSAWELWLDGGHNDSAGEVLAAQMAVWRQQDGDQPKPLVMILGMLSTKTPQEFLAPLVLYVDRLCTVTIEDESLSITANDLATLARHAGIQKASAAANLCDAIQIVTQPHSPAARLLICGSLYLAGQVLRRNSL